MTTTDTPRPTRSQALAAVKRLCGLSAKYAVNSPDEALWNDREVARRECVAMIEALIPEPDQHAGAEKVCLTMVQLRQAVSEFMVMELDYARESAVMAERFDPYALTASVHLAGAGPAADQVVISKEAAEAGARACFILAKQTTSNYWERNWQEHGLELRRSLNLPEDAAIAAADGRNP